MLNVCVKRVCALPIAERKSTRENEKRERERNGERTSARDMDDYENGERWYRAERSARVGMSVECVRETGRVHGVTGRKVKTICSVGVDARTHRWWPARTPLPSALPSRGK